MPRSALRRWFKLLVAFFAAKASSPDAPLYVWWTRDMALDLSSFYRGELAEVRRAPAAFLEVVMRIGVDLGGTKIEAIAIDESGNELWRRRVATPIENYDEILGAIRNLVLAAENELSQKCAVGIGSPGAISPSSGLIRNSNSTVLNGRPLDRDLSECLGRPIRLENDTNCFALSEATDGAASSGRVVFGAILGTGVGGGIVIDKVLISGRNRIAGEWGHNPLPWHTKDERRGPKCYCGKDGCIEMFLSGAGLSRGYYALTRKNLSATAIAMTAKRGDGEAINCLSLYRNRLARSLAAVINVLDPDIIVLGGGLSNIDDIYHDLITVINEFVFTDALDTAIVRACHGDSSGVRGAACLWPATFR
jgi:fructokinase